MAVCEGNVDEGHPMPDCVCFAQKVGHVKAHGRMSKVKTSYPKMLGMIGTSPNCSRCREQLPPGSPFDKIAPHTFVMAPSCPFRPPFRPSQKKMRLKFGARATRFWKRQTSPRVSLHARERQRVRAHMSTKMKLVNMPRATTSLLRETPGGVTGLRRMNVLRQKDLSCGRQPDGGQHNETQKRRWGHGRN